MAELKGISKEDEMTVEEYLGHSGRLCPYCRSRDIFLNWSACQIDSLQGHVHCCDCSKEWTETYKLTGVLELEND